ncbi:hypothetical protein llap_21900 [Limosa lapponica baueri]|uniref:Serine-threonine/tyrosine-protein kinase catalytic domain-containing protein n=1 Tax=Limosa lapponica baueri TaxID=1758121 RepID=A0A2I0T1W6_LIMLA|nr:hypothetical protein llap_21900 [Limosa lapponica baueri]
MCLAMEYGGEKSLCYLLEERQEKKLGPFPAATIFKVALSMARGLKVRLTSTVALRVSDPELRYVGTEPWKPKEALEDDGVITDKADIFAFGLTLWEMMTLSVPHLNLDDDLEDEGLSLDLVGEELLLLGVLFSLHSVVFAVQGLLSASFSFLIVHEELINDGN